MYFCIAALLDDSSQNEIRKNILETFRKYDLGVTALLLPQHISLKISFPTDQFDNLAIYFDKLCLSQQPFQISLHKLELVPTNDFGRESGILWLNVSDDTNLRTIHNQLNNDFPQVLGITNSEIDGDRFRFHTTLAYGGKTYKEYRRIHSAITKDFNQMMVKINRLAIFCSLQDKIKAGQFFTYRIGKMPIKSHSLLNLSP